MKQNDDPAKQRKERRTQFTISASPMPKKKKPVEVGASPEVERPSRGGDANIGSFEEAEASTGSQKSRKSTKNRPFKHK